MECTHTEAVSTCPEAQPSHPEQLGLSEARVSVDSAPPPACFPPSGAWSTASSVSGQVQLSLVAQSCLTLCDPVDCSTPGLPVHHQLPELTQTHVHGVSDAIQPSHVVPFASCLQSFPASGSFQMSQLFTSGGQSTGVSASASVFPVNTQD